MPKRKRVTVSRDGHTARVRLRPWLIEMDADKPDKVKDAVSRIPQEAVRAVIRDVNAPQRIVIDLRPARDGFWKATVTSTRTCIWHIDCDAFDAAGYTGKHPQRRTKGV